MLPSRNSLSFVRRATSCDRPVIELIEKIKKNDPDLIEANFSNKSLGVCHVRFLCEAIESNTFALVILSSLYHSNYKTIFSPLYSRIARALGNNTSIVNVDLRYNRILPARIAIFGEALKTNFRLRVLKFKEDYEEKDLQRMEQAELTLEANLNANKAVYLTMEGRNNVLDLSGRRLMRIDNEIAMLSHIEYANLSGNLFQCMPDIEWHKLVDLDLSNNSLQSLPKTFICMQSLTNLNLSRNKFREIPVMISLLPALQTLDISDNAIIRLEDIPLCSLGNHTQLKSLLIHGNHFIKSSYRKISKNICEQRDGAIVLEEIRKLPSADTRTATIQIFFLGDSNEGKTSTIRSLMVRNKRKRSKKRRNFEEKYQNNPMFIRHPWRVFYKQGNKKKSKKHIDFQCLDWTAMTPLYQLCLSPHSIYILTSSLPLTKEKIRNMKQYTNSITTILGEIPTILVVLTFAEKYPESTVFDALKLLKTHLSGLISKIIPVSNSTGKGVSDLSSIILHMAHRLPQFEKVVPTSYQYLEENVEALRFTKEYRPIITSEQILLLLKHSGVPVSERNMALNYLHDKGVLIYWNSEHIALGDYVILDYELLLHMYYKIILYYSPTNTVLVDLNDLHDIWRDYGEITRRLVRIVLERFEILSLTNQSDMALISYLIPKHTPMAAKALPPPSKRRVWRRSYCFTSFPCTFYGRFVNALLDLFPKVLMWQTGLVFTRDAELDTVVASEIGLVEFDYAGNHVYFEVPMGWPSYYLTRISTIIEEIVSPYRDIQYKMLIPCSHCIRKKGSKERAYQFSIMELSSLSEQNIKDANCYVIPDTPVLVPISQLAPDAALKHMKHLLIRSDDLILEKQIGAGTYGRVYKARYHNFTVAVKVLNKIEETENQARLFAEFRREIQFMSELHDPHLIQLRGVASLPDFCVVQDYCPAGDLHNYLQGYYKAHQAPPPLGYCLHVAYNISKGMQYLHSCNPPVLHRDLKSPNVLLLHTVEQLEKSGSQYHLNIGVIAKITDFGLSSQCNLPYSSRIVDNPLWLAPEIMDQNPYTKKVDVYSFAIILFELISCKVPFAEYNIHFTSKLEEKIRKENLRPTIPPECDPSCAKLIEECWHPNPSYRPSFKHISTTLLNIMVANQFASELSLTLAPNEISVIQTSESESDTESSNTESDTEFYKPPIRRRSRLKRSRNSPPVIPTVRRAVSHVGKDDPY